MQRKRWNGWTPRSKEGNSSRQVENAAVSLGTHDTAFTVEFLPRMISRTNDPPHRNLRSATELRRANLRDFAHVRRCESERLTASKTRGRGRRGMTGRSRHSCPLTGIRPVGERPDQASRRTLITSSCLRPSTQLTARRRGAPSVLRRRGRCGQFGHGSNRRRFSVRPA
jgi:hypothetical protein